MAPWFTRRTLIGAVLATPAAGSLAGCVGPTGPVFGDWYGYQTGCADGYDRSVALVLDGTPDARGGTFHYRAFRRLASLGWGGVAMDGVERWDGQWRLHTVPSGGQTWTRVDLSGLPPTERAAYILMDRHVLVPVVVGGSGPDLSQLGLESRLVPRPTTAYGYGRV
ncbi:hypothetical protein AA103196_0512 [Ameyamaea chiangmaiensis NBRC 103196]|uniref:Lipoprotein n=1 Tax=Ameyamaea chiangmaiensis TaxID=442969 RepID=A0A850P9S3_9PROT|nr:hypothetical protein [Ameyamaea chiangmaiensis]MBS4074908.1 hypothetical protein [Ameyamaea chiangmaiensis]NVN40784.1 hypothetical protein [Ameyamaea chiangmaiensis]GBQ63183.1 hypothetical protein AA103196_0512 [Ameyamaea chiangmaiensis NBRC 103196]